MLEVDSVITENGYSIRKVWVIIITNNNNNVGLRYGLVGLGLKAHLKGLSFDNPFCFKMGKPINP